MPLAPTELIGRSEEVNALCNRLLGHGGRLLTLVGPPGIGKTRLALAVTARLQHLYPDAAVFVPLAEVTDGVWMASNRYFQEVVTIATTLGYTGMQSEWQSLLAITTLYEGDALEARRLLNESLRRCLDQRNTILSAQVCTYLAEVSL